MLYMVLFLQILIRIITSIMYNNNNNNNDSFPDNIPDQQPFSAFLLAFSPLVLYILGHKIKKFLIHHFSFNNVIKLSCLRTCPSHLCFLHQIVFNMLLPSLAHTNTSSFVTFSVQLIFSILRHVHISNPSNSFLLAQSTSRSLLHTVLHSKLCYL